MPMLPVVIVLLLALLIGYQVLIRYYLAGWKRLGITDPAASADVRISVVIAARNEAKNIAACLRSIREQTWPAGQTEVIVIDDHSTDDTAAIVAGFDAPNITLIRLADVLQGSPINSYKKKAIETGVARATGELIVTTDADCVAHPDWLRSLAGAYRDREAAFVAAPVRIEARRSLLSVFQALDFIALQGITGASVYHDLYPMCNGANLAYSREAFLRVNGFAGIDGIASGDDMLLMQKIRKAYPGGVRYVKRSDAIVQTEPAASWGEFMQQRIRWASKTSHYDYSRTFYTLLFVYLLNVAGFAALVAGFFDWRYFLVFAGFMIQKTLIEYPFVQTVSMFFGQQRLMRYFAFLQPIHIVYTVAAGAFGKLGRYRWKNRVVK